MDAELEDFLISLRVGVSGSFSLQFLVLGDTDRDLGGDIDSAVDRLGAREFGILEMYVEGIEQTDCMWSGVFFEFERKGSVVRWLLCFLWNVVLQLVVERVGGGVFG
jgi:hypothetical protein